MKKPSHSNVIPITHNIFKDICELHKADLIIYNGEIDEIGADKLIEITTAPTHENVLLYLCTYGGDADAAFRIARRLQSKYKKFQLYIHGYCKSAGTLIAIGSDEIIMSDFAEFGPLDVQIKDKEEMFKLSSGLDVFQTLAALSEQSLSYYQQCLLSFSTMGLATKHATTIASNLTNNFFNPILSQIEAIQIGGLDRAVKIAIKYGEILIKHSRGNIAPDKLKKLVLQYPCHTFVIDRDEAKEIFKAVRDVNEKERSLDSFLMENMRVPSTTQQRIEKIYPCDSQIEDLPDEKEL